MKQRDQWRFLLLQIRDDDLTANEELQGFIDFGATQPDQFSTLNVFVEPDFDADDFLDYDALFIGGSSDASVREPEKYPFIAPCCELVRAYYEMKKPVFAPCFGFQLAVLELGGEIILDADNMEMGVYPIHITNEASDDPLLHDLPPMFHAVSGHKERASKLPDNAVRLAFSELCPEHIFKFPDRPFYAFQFHPEVDGDILVARYTRYASRYADDPAIHDFVRHTKQISTDISTSLVARFIDRIMPQT